MRRMKLVGWAAAALVAVALAPMRQAHGLSCADNFEDIITLEIESVTEDGVTVSDMSAYTTPEVTLVGRRFAETSGFQMVVRIDSDEVWLEDYE